MDSQNTTKCTIRTKYKQLFKLTVAQLFMSLNLLNLLMGPDSERQKMARVLSN